MSRKEIFDEINDERTYQDGKWGMAFDDKNTLNDWNAYIAQYGAQGSKIGVCKAEQRIAMLKVASLAIAALEAFDRNNGFAPRHYD